MADAASLSLEDLNVGDCCTFDVAITTADIDHFAEISGDFSPLHMDAGFARQRGFEGRVVHGAYLAGLVSRLLGMHLPGRYCLWQKIQMTFAAPAYAGYTVRVTGTVDQVSESVSAAVIKATITNAADGNLLARATANIGITKVS